MVEYTCAGRQTAAFNSDNISADRSDLTEYHVRDDNYYNAFKHVPLQLSGFVFSVRSYAAHLWGSAICVYGFSLLACMQISSQAHTFVAQLYLMIARPCDHICIPQTG